MGAALVLWLAATSAPAEGDVLPAGLHCAGVLLQACEAIDSRPTVTANPELANQPVRLHVDLPVNADTLESIEVLLRSVGIYRLDYVDDKGEPFAFVTADPRRPPKRERAFRVAVWKVENADIEVVAAVLNKKVEQLETEHPKERTRFVPYVRTGRLLVRYHHPEHLDAYRSTLAELDAPPERVGPRMHYYSPKRSRAIDLVEELREAWEKESDVGPLRATAMRGRNMVVLRIYDEDWERALELLESFDRAP